MIPAKPTTGAGGVNFRSRLEARWAQFFTLMDWPWQYEPDMDFNGWLPDFAITSGGGLLVEVKPAITMAGLIPHRERIERSGAVAQVWLVGGALSFAKGNNDHQPIVGWHGFAGGDTLDGSSIWMWSPAYFENGLHRGLRDLVDQPEPRNFGLAQRLWIQAGNELQWRRK